jgi:hypothetical protein
MRDILCPVCNSELLLSGDEEAGDLLTCPACSCPLAVRDFGDEGEPILVEDF